ncbi:MAG: hypothetical protein WDZ88_01025 [Candidatus Paceibacterota bacterium]
MTIIDGFIDDPDKEEAIREALREIYLEKGSRAEELFLRSVQNMPLPAWCKEIKRATEYEDLHENTDFIAETNSGVVRIQIKSSIDGLRYFLEKVERGEINPEILCVVVNPADTPRQVVANFLPLFTRWKKKLERGPKVSDNE